MKKKKITSVVLSALIVIGLLLAILAHYNVLPVTSRTDAAGIDLLTNIQLFGGIVVALMSIIGLLGTVIAIKKDKPISKGFYSFKLVGAATGLLVLVLSVMFIFINLPFYDNVFLPRLFEMIILCFIIPVLTVVDFAFFTVTYKRDWRNTFYALIPTGIYLIYMLILTVFTGFFTPTNGLEHIFFLPGQPTHPLWMHIGSWLLGLLIVYASAFLLYWFNIAFVEFIENKANEGKVREVETTYVIENKAEPKEEKEVADKPATNKEVAVKKESASDAPHIYHISRHPSGEGWQVKFANGKKAVKILPTQAEAIEYANSLVASRDDGSSIRVHSRKGKIRKA